ncbi:CD63 antigen-like [Cydia pomonella]|uniref:CD63 antigen-like n=1 Tax=Cydia pomonella TaxID=82600 RepID=UPI002ADD8AAB|nr:CD63 antigen-like [Cydia pomonella]
MKIPSVKLPNIFKSVRYNLAAVNGIFVLTGALLLIVGVVVLVENIQYEDFLTNRFYTVPAFAIATSVLILLISVLGFYAALSEKFYIVAVYLAGLIFILIDESAITIAAYSLVNDVNSEIRAPMASSLQLYESRLDIAKLWDELHTEFECCGVVGVNDWQSTRVPISCCHIDYGTVSPFNCTSALAYNTGCIVSLGEWLSHNMFVLAVSALVVTCIQIVLTTIGSWLTWRSRFESVELES